MVVMLFSFLLLSSDTRAQLLKRVKDEIKNRAENKAVQEAGNTTDKALDKAKEEAIGTTKGKDDKEAASPTEAPENGSTANNSKTVKADYRSYDFVPGDQIIFQPDLSEEADAELPARFSIQKGNAEIQSYEGEKILHLDAGGQIIVMPLMSTERYLPEQFTVEFDMMYENDKDYFAFTNNFIVRFYTPDDENYEGYGLYEFMLHSNTQAALGKHTGAPANMTDALQKAVQTNDTWHHIAIYARKNIGKAYINQYRVAATNNLPVAPGKLAIVTDGRYSFKIKNFRLAAGGDDKYDKIVTSGRFITHGILFDVNKSTIKDESMGTLNEIVKLMKEHSDLKFEIDGHTDSDGDDNANMKLSQSRADAVKVRLMDMGIDKSRLSTRGFGATKPMDKNDTAEGKANNRRVEFVKR